MIIACAGKPVRGDGVPIPTNMIAKLDTTPGNIYEIFAKAKIKDIKKITKENIKKVEQELYDRFKAKLKYIEIGRKKDGDYVTLQVEGSPFAMEAFMTALPTILEILGIVLLAASVLLVVKKATWEVFLLVIGFLMFSGVLTSLLGKGKGE